MHAINIYKTNQLGSQQRVAILVKPRSGSEIFTLSQ